MLANEGGVRYLSVFIGISTTPEHIYLCKQPCFSFSCVCFSYLLVFILLFILLCISSLHLLTGSFPTSVKNALILSLIAVAMAAGSGSAL